MESNEKIEGLLGEVVFLLKKQNEILEDQTGLLNQIATSLQPPLESKLVLSLGEAVPQ